MPYATRSGVINFPKKKLVVKREVKNAISSSKTPIKETSPESSTPSITSSARKALHSCDVLIGREKEIEEITTFLKNHLENQSCGSIYISGLPGTGKTACMNYILKQNEFVNSFRVVKINCTAFNCSSAVFKRICEELHLKVNVKKEKDAITFIENFLVKKHKMILLVLDEIDQLESKSQSVLYRIFEWPSLKNSKFLLIGIANAIDFTDRYLPRISTKNYLKPMLLHFAPYSKEQIASILKKRLTDAGADNIFAPGAIELISAKVAGTSGDIRRALDLGKRVIEVAEQNQTQVSICQPSTETITLKKECSTKQDARSSFARTPKKLELFVNEMIDCVKTPPKKKLSFFQVSSKKDLHCNFENSEIVSSDILNASKPSTYLLNSSKIRKSPRKSRDLNCLIENNENFESPKKKAKMSSSDTSDNKLILNEKETLRRSPRKLQFDVNPKDVLSVVKGVFGSKNLKSNEELTFPLHQKLLICSLLLMIKNGSKKDLSIGKLHQVYSKVCTKKGLTAMDKSGFIFLCRQIEMTGIINLSKGPGIFAKVSLQWDESEVTNSLKDHNLLSSILHDSTFLV